MIIKHIAALIIFSLVILFANEFIRVILHEIVTIHDWFYGVLGQIFSGAGIGNQLRLLISIFFVPAIIMGVPAGIYYLIKKNKMPHMLLVFWISWIVQAVTICLTSNSLF